MSQKPTLLGIPYSPWTERARWALDYAKVPYRFQRFQPVIGEAALRWKLGTIRKVTVPVLFEETGKVIASDSVDIARFAGKQEPASSLFPEVHEEEITRWIATAERALDAGRSLVAKAMIENAEVLESNVPRSLPKLLRLPMGRFGMKVFLNKYALAGRSEREDAAQLGGVLAETRAGLAGRKYFVGDTFTFADVAVATMINAISPPDAPHLRLSAALRACWTQPALATQYADLLTWRDELYASSRRAEVDLRPVAG